MLIATGGTDFHRDSQHPDNAYCIFEYQTPRKNWIFPSQHMLGKGDYYTTRISCSVQTASVSEGVFEIFMGEYGHAKINEWGGFNHFSCGWGINRWNSITAARESGLIERFDPIEKTQIYNETVRVRRATTAWPGYKPIVEVHATAVAPIHFKLAVEKREYSHTHHLLNFFDTIRNKGLQTDLNCPAEEAFRTCVSALKVNEAIKRGARIDYSPKDFQV